MKIPTIETEKHIVCQFCILFLQLHVLQQTWDISIAETIVLSCLCKWVFVFTANTWEKGNMCQYECKYKDVFCILVKTWTGKEGKGKMKTVASNVRQYEWGAASLKIPAHSHTMASPGNMSIFGNYQFSLFSNKYTLLWICVALFLQLS